MNNKTKARIELVLGAITTLDTDRIVATIERVLREQDRDTRHACAEAVCSISRDYDAFQGGDHACQIVIRAEIACMNAHAV